VTSCLYYVGNVGTDKGSIVELLLSNRNLPTPDYSNRLLQFVAKLSKAGEELHLKKKQLFQNGDVLRHKQMKWLLQYCIILKAFLALIDTAKLLFS